MTPPNNPQLAQQVVDFLNDVLKLSPEALSSLVEYRVPCTQALADHPTVQCGLDLDPKTWTVGLLGILNGLYGCQPTRAGFIVAISNADSDRIEQFKFDGGPDKNAESMP